MVENPQTPDTTKLDRTQKFGMKYTIPLSGKENNSLHKFARKDLSEPFKGTEVGGVIKGFDKATGWLDKKVAGWAGKKEGGEKK